MGFCCSKPQVDEDETEQTALLGEHAESIHEPQVPDRFANMNSEEVARIKEEERLKALEQCTTEALINISHHSGFAGQAMGSSGHHARDYTEVLRRFNQEVQLPMVTLAGPGGVDVAAVLSDGRISERDAELMDTALNRIIDAISVVHIDPPPGDCIVSLSIPSNSF
ncbi:hypothetical protein LPJ78_000010 [Coemansia sp. RSA 989]|nr:hypothetical protein LPJ68_000129 [Coemansia sp. RSA 1086]KAJ1753681.1 hypothetical protein LPJ79_000274 [Coemansia sp. RSA 1821]KAJ1868498.1 hypothetical protein LPJ78_000010 [Coemansia sp. RSA 989]KAJ1876108.1 hypothetical protein LPJ55_000010 [Coemansia sp. RSA 990]KAJ2631587.1 hypothetical protein H4R22_001879 [Coemansia sp. RSA 1290]KAJ2652381.1 hypothetical protein IWW40_001236 [Coemansia sp. RSA 1250]